MKPEEILNQLKQVMDNCCELFNNDGRAICKWLLEDNSYFFNESPLTWVLLGKGEAVLNLQDGMLDMASRVDDFLAENQELMDKLAEDD